MSYTQMTRPRTNAYTRTDTCTKHLLVRVLILICGFTAYTCGQGTGKCVGVMLNELGRIALFLDLYIIGNPRYQFLPFYDERERWPRALGSKVFGLNLCRQLNDHLWTND